MNPAFLDSMSWEMAEVYGAISDQILINLAKYFPYYKPGGTVPKSAFAYQAAMLAQMGQVNAETIQIIRNGLKDANKALSGVLEQAIIDSVSKAEKPLLKAVKMGVFSPPLTPIVAPNQMRAFKLYYEQAANKLNLVNTVMLESTQSAYQQAVNNVALNVQIAERIQATQTALDIGAGETVTGVSSWNQALRHSIERMKQSGITGFVDHAGRHWSAEAYAAMDIRTTVMNTARAAVWETNETFGNDLYLVSYHQGARPLCYDWQNKVISSLNNARTVTDLDGNEIHVYAQSETSYGEAAGLFGINCKHTADPFIPGVSLIRGQPQSEEENAKTYAESQEQRRLERKLREEKRDILMAKAQGAQPDEIKALQAKAHKTSQDIDTFCEETGRARHRDREGVYTERAFPSKDKYNVAEFERTQKEQIDQFFKDGGAQQQYKAGVLEPKTPIVPQAETPAVVEPVQTQTPAVDNAGTQASTFVPAKTRAEAEQYAREHFATNVDYSGLSVANANKINETLAELTRDYPIKQLEHIIQRPQGSIARANFEHLEINGKKLGKTLQDEELNFRLNQAFARNEIAQIRKRYEGKARLPYDAEKKIERLERTLKFKRWGVQSAHTDHVRAVVAHEYGHILSDQYFGMINDAAANPNYNTNWSLRGMAERWRKAFDMAQSDGSIFELSEYGSKNPREFFAEWFAARVMGESLPDYVEELMNEVLKNGIM